jgi:plasmid stabilization system protein ParE
VRSIFLSPEAEDDLIQAAEYLDRETGNAVFGHRLHDEIDHVMNLIVENPLMGRARPDLQNGLRGFPHGQYTIFWRLRENEIEIVRVLHQRQDVEREFGIKR